MNPYLKIGVAAILATYVVPKFVNRYLKEELTDTDAQENSAIIIGASATTAAAIFAAISSLMAGKPTVGAA